MYVSDLENPTCVCCRVPILAGGIANEVLINRSKRFHIALWLGMHRLEVDTGMRLVECGSFLIQQSDVDHSHWTMY